MFGRKRQISLSARRGDRQRAAIDHEREMVDYAQRMCDVRRKATAVHIHLSRATGFGYDNYVYAINMFKSLVTRFQGKLFILHNHDLIFAYHGPPGEPAIKSAIFNIRLLFDVGGEGDCDAGFATWYDLERDHQRFLGVAESFLSQRDRLESKEEEDESPPAQGGEILAALLQFMQGLDATDLSGLVRRQAVCRFVEAQPQPVFHELYVSIVDLERRLAPAYRLTSDRYLFQYVTHALDRRVLSLVRQQVELLPAARFSLNINLATFLSEDFDAFDTALSDGLRRSVVLEFQRVDVLADIGAFLVVRDQARERGYRVCLDGISHRIVPYVRLADLDLDLVKLTWIGGMDEEGGELVRRLVGECGAERIVLCHCDGARAIDFGRETGIGLFQGRRVDALLAGGGG